MQPSISDQNPKVWLTQEVSSFNYTQAEEYGDLFVLTRDEVSPVKNSLKNQHLVNELKAKLAHFNPETDFVCFSGSPSVAALVFMIIGSKHNKMKLLRWSGRDQTYVPLYIEI